MYRVLDNRDVLIPAEMAGLSEHILELVSNDKLVQAFIRDNSSEEGHQAAGIIQLLLLEAAIVGQP